MRSKAFRIIIETRILPSCKCIRNTFVTASAPVNRSLRSISQKFFDSSKMADGTRSMEQFFDRFWHWRLKSSPEFATEIGIPGFEDKLNDVSLQHYSSMKDDLLSFMKEIAVLQNERRSDCDPCSDLQILKNEMNNIIQGFEYKPYFYPLNQLEGPQNTFPRLISWMKKETSENYSDILSRMNAFPKKVDQIIAMLQNGIDSRLTMHSVSISAVPKQIECLLKLPEEESELFKPFLLIPESIPEADRIKLKEDGFKTVKETVYPAYRALKEYIETKYIQYTRKSIASSSLPNGDAYYKACLKFHTTTNLSASEIHSIGLKEVEKILQRVYSIQEQVGFKGDIKAFLQHLRSDKEFLFNNKDEMLLCYKNICKEIESKISTCFNTFPKKDYKILAVPEEFADSFPGAYYLSASIDGTRPGTFYVNTSHAEKRCKHEAVSLALHEAIPGHHHQISLSLEMVGEPNFKKHLEDDSYYLCPGRFSMCSAFVEGWGLYSEFLGEELGLYKTPYDLLGRLSHELLRASRLVVDTGMHALGWSKEKAIEFMSTNTATSDNDIVAEIDRYITWPGQACAYKIGEITIRRLRSKAEDELGDKFNVKEYHNAVLMHGNVPLDILEANVINYISKSK